MSVSLSTQSHHHHMHSQKSSASSQTAATDSTTSTSTASSAPSSGSTATSTLEAPPMSPALSGFLSVLSQIQTSSSADSSDDSGSSDSSTLEASGAAQPTSAGTGASSSDALAADLQQLRGLLTTLAGDLGGTDPTTTATAIPGSTMDPDTSGMGRPQGPPPSSGGAASASTTSDATGPTSIAATDETAKMQQLLNTLQAYASQSGTGAGAESASG